VIRNPDKLDQGSAAGSVLERGPGNAACTADGGSDSVVRHAAAHRSQAALVVSIRALVLPERDFGRSQQRDLLRAAGGRGIELDGDGRTERSDPEQRCVLLYSDRGSHFWLTPKAGGQFGA
jgi:hypothetical protein